MAERKSREPDPRARGRHGNYELVAGLEGLHRPISGPRIQKPGLALTGYTPVRSSRAIAGARSHPKFPSCVRSVTKLARWASPHCARSSLRRIVVTRGLELPPELIACGDQYKVPVFRTPLSRRCSSTGSPSGWKIGCRPLPSVHGVLIDVLGVASWSWASRASARAKPRSISFAWPSPSCRRHRRNP